MRIARRKPVSARVGLSPELVDVEILEPGQAFFDNLHGFAVHYLKVARRFVENIFKGFFDRVKVSQKIPRPTQCAPGIKGEQQILLHTQFLYIASFRKPIRGGPKLLSVFLLQIGVQNEFRPHPGPLKM